MDGRLSQRLVAATAAAALLAAGCGEETRSPPRACDGTAASISDALARAPGRVALADGTALSTCVERARSDGDVQTIGSLYTVVARDLAGRAARSESAALQLGYLIGAVRRGASRTNGVHAELRRRIEQTLGVEGVPPQRRAAFRRGLIAGARRG
jgi:hypothetical protein